MRLSRVAALAAALVLGCAGTASAGVKIQLYQAGVEDSVGMAADDKGNIYVLSEFAYISKVTPDGQGSFLPFTLPVVVPTSQRGRALVWGPDHALWFRCNDVTCHVDPNGAGLIDSPSYGYGTPGVGSSFWSVDPAAHTVTRMTPAGVVTVFQGLPTSCSTTVGQMIAGPDGGMWFLCDHALVSVTGSGTITARTLPASFVSYGSMTFGADGNLWVATANGIARVDPDGAVLAQYPLAAQATSVALGPDGDVWFTYYAAGGVGRVSPSGHVSDYSEQIGETQNPSTIVRAADGGMWVDAFYRPYVWRIDPDPPSALTEAAAGLSSTGATLNAVVDPHGGPTTAYFEWGTTTAYGSRTAIEDLGDGDAGVLTSAALAGLTPDTTYHYRVVAVNGMRTVRGKDRTLATDDPLTITSPPTPRVPTRPDPAPDVDGDGYPEGVDCDDHAASVHPGAVDRPGDKLDQDCSGAPAPWGRLAPPVDAQWSTHGARTTFTRLTVGALPAKATISLGCSGRGCAFKTYTSKIRTAVKRTDLLVRLKRSHLRRGARITLRLAVSGRATTVIRWRIGPPTRRTTTCLAPGARAEMPCG